jgi:hypothetical protein
MARALKVAIVAGTIYNLINQGEKLIDGPGEHFNILKLCLTYATPYFVSTYTAVSMRLAACRTAGSYSCE